jgi:hypothetical protein
METTIVVALITTVGGVLVALMQAFRKETRNASEARLENRDDHQVVQAQLKMIFGSVTRLDDKVDQHLNQHGVENGTIRRDTTQKQ